MTDTRADPIRYAGKISHRATDDDQSQFTRGTRLVTALPPRELREKLRGARIEPAREEEDAGVVMRSLGFVVLAVPVMFALGACAGATDSQADLSAGYTDAELGQNSVAGEPLQASWPGSPFPLLSFEDREAIGRVAYAEAGNQGEEGIAAVIFTILNRVNSGSAAACRA